MMRKKRKILEEIKYDNAEKNELYQELRELSKKFQKGLNGIFLSDNGTDFYELVKHYGVF